MRTLKQQRPPLPSEGYGLIIGWDAICGYMRHRLSTLQRWRDKYGFPVSILPGGNVCTTTSLIDAWLQARAEVYNSERTRLGKRKFKKSLSLEGNDNVQTEAGPGGGQEAPL